MIHGILLAAGSSKRFGSQKLLTILPNNKLLVLASAEHLCEIVDDFSVVVNTQDARLTKIFLEKHISIVSCSQSEFGIGHSIACGVANTRDATGWVIALADMPFIKLGTIQSVVRTLREGALIVVPVFEGRRGHPVGFSKKLYPELVTLEGDVGARSLLEKYKSAVKEINCKDPGVVIDIDVPEDLYKHYKDYLR